MQLPPPGQEPTAEWFAAFQALPLEERLSLAVEVAARLRSETDRAFPGAEHTPLPAGTSVDDRIAAGEAVASELLGIAMQLAPEQTLDRMDQNLSSDTTSAEHANELLQRLTDKGISK